MNSEFDDSLIHMENTFVAHNFWRDKIHELYSNREKGMEFEREISELCPPFKHLMRKHEFALQRKHLLFDFKDKWDSDDGNPIFYGYIPKTYRAVRIIQAPPQDATNQLSAWVEKSFSNFSKEIRAFDASGSYELVIYIEMNSHTFRYAMILIYFWISRRAVKPHHEEMLIEMVYNTKIRGQNTLG
ncbi:TPA: hypothetical protein ACSC6M_000479 [Enterobacter roggenkampii]|uniref:hypothetical protein n=1 Tax=Enterobacter TaxID=547 RepID=UPI0031E06538